MNKTLQSAAITAAMTVGLLILLNQFEPTRNLVNGDNPFFR